MYPSCLTCRQNPPYMLVKVFQKNHFYQHARVFYHKNKKSWKKTTAVIGVFGEPMSDFCVPQHPVHWYCGLRTILFRRQKSQFAFGPTFLKKFFSIFSKNFRKNFANLLEKGWSVIFSFFEKEPCVIFHDPWPIFKNSNFFAKIWTEKVLKNFKSEKINIFQRRFRNLRPLITFSCLSVFAISLSLLPRNWKIDQGSGVHPLAFWFFGKEFWAALCLISVLAAIWNTSAKFQFLLVRS